MDQLTRMYQVRRTCWQMLHDRGYLVASDQLEASKEEFRMQFGDQPSRGDLTILCPHHDDPTRRLFVFFPEESKVGVKTIKQLTDRMREEQVGRAIMVVAQSLTPFARAVVSELSGRQAIEIFTEAELLVNITHHVLVPEHRVLSEDEKRTLLARYRVRESQLPRVQLADPVARYYGLQRGQVVRIVRPSETAGRYVTYRYCI